MAIAAQRIYEGSVNSFPRQGHSMGVPFIPTGIDHIVIWVRDLARAKAWYCDVLGCRAGYEYPEIAMTHLWYGPVLLGLWDADDPKASYAAPEAAKNSKTRQAGQNLHHIAFAWSGAAEQDVQEHLARHGVEIIRSLRQTGSRGFGLALYFRDPWGNLIELKGPAEAKAPVPE